MYQERLQGWGGQVRDSAGAISGQDGKAADGGRAGSRGRECGGELLRGWGMGCGVCGEDREGGRTREMWMIEASRTLRSSRLHDSLLASVALLLTSAL